MEDLLDWLGEESRSFDRTVIVENLRPLQVNVETTTDVSPHNDISDILGRSRGRNG